MQHRATPASGSASPAETVRAFGDQSLLGFDEAVIRAHVGMLHDLAAGVEGIIPLCTYGEDPGDRADLSRKLPPFVPHFRVGDVDGMVKAIMGLECQPHRNVYLPAAVMRTSLEPGQKGGESDVIAVLGLVLDDDADAGRNVRSPITPTYVVETSSTPWRNRQLFHFFSEPLTPQEAKPLALALRDAAGGDHGAVDLSHVWRVPGTLNWPNATLATCDDRGLDYSLRRFGAHVKAALSTYADLRGAGTGGRA